MKKEDEQKVRNALTEISKMKYDSNANDFKKGMANLADSMLTILYSHGGSEEYRTAVRNLVIQSRN